MATLIFLAGRQGSRFGAVIPKQYLSLGDKKIFDHSFEIFQKSPFIQEIIVICAPESFLFASPGNRRQDSASTQAFKKTTGETVLTHNSARPFIEEKYFPLLLEAIETVPFSLSYDQHHQKMRLKQHH